VSGDARAGPRPGGRRATRKNVQPPPIPTVSGDQVAGGLGRPGCRSGPPRTPSRPPARSLPLPIQTGSSKHGVLNPAVGKEGGRDAAAWARSRSQEPRTAAGRRRDASLVGVGRGGGGGGGGELPTMPTMILLIGMKMSFTKKPMKPMMKKPTDVACAIFENSARGGRSGRQRVGASG